MSEDASLEELLRTADAGDHAAASALFGVLYRELRDVAERELRRGGAGLTLGTTTLLHEAYLRLSDRDDLLFANRTHFLAYAATAMRRLTINYARHRRAQKRGGEFHLVALPIEDVAEIPSTESGVSAESLEQLGDALETLASVDQTLAELVDLHFFCGLSLVEIAELRGVSTRTVERHWRQARLLLHRTLEAR